MSGTGTSTRRLVRRTDDRIVAGVASGLAANLGIDPVLVRVGFVLLAVAGGFGVLAYVVLWALLPEGVPTGAPMAAGRRDAGFWVAIALFVLAALAIADNFSGRDVVWPLVLIAAGVALWRREAGGADPPPADAGAADAAAAAPAPAVPPLERTAPMTTSVTPDAVAWTPPPVPGEPAPAPSHQPHRPRRPRSPLGGITVAIALLTSGVLTALAQAGAISYPLHVGLAVALLVLAGGLLVGTWVGRARWLVFPAIVLTPFVLFSGVATNLDVPLGAGIGERRHVAASLDTLEPGYTLGIGDLDVDLTSLDLAGTTAATRVRLGLGQITVRVPDDVTVVVTYDVRGGDVNVLGERASGTPATGTVTADGAPGAGTLELDIDLTFGEIVVVRDNA